jgi:hypothetical protein
MGGSEWTARGHFYGLGSGTVGRPIPSIFDIFYSISISVINYFDAIFYKLTRQGKE